MPCELKQLARKAGMTFEIQIAGRTLFARSTDGAAPSQAEWIRRKRNVVMRFGRSSYAMGLLLEKEGKTIEQRHGLTLDRLRDARRRRTHRVTRAQGWWAAWLPVAWTSAPTTAWW